MRDLQSRLKEKGFDWPFVREYILPDWWQDELADVEANRALAEAYIAKLLGFKATELRDRERALTFPPMERVQFKRYKNHVDDRVRASALVAQRAAEAVVRSLGDQLPDLCARKTATAIRSSILRESSYVTLVSLLDFCWSVGIPVVQLEKIPASGKRFDGMATFVGARPVIVLASGRDGPAWLVFHLAHELGHIMLGHVAPGKKALVDGTLTSETGKSTYEREADRFACEVLTGFPNPHLDDLQATAPRLAVIAQREGPGQGIDPGVYALIYARSNRGWPVAQSALKYLDLDAGGQATVTEALHEHLADLELSETDERFLNVLKAA